jgi:hypothetical protein
MESLSPNIFTNDIKNTVAFYQLLGFNITMSVPEEGDELVWAMMVNGSVTVMLQTFESLADELPEISRNAGGSLLLYINVTAIRDFFESIKDLVPVLKGWKLLFMALPNFLYSTLMATY